MPLGEPNRTETSSKTSNNGPSRSFKAVHDPCQHRSSPASQRLQPFLCASTAEGSTKWSARNISKRQGRPTCWPSIVIALKPTHDTGGAHIPSPKASWVGLCHLVLIVRALVLAERQQQQGQCAQIPGRARASVEYDMPRDEPGCLRGREAPEGQPQVALTSHCDAISIDRC